MNRKIRKTLSMLAAAAVAAMACAPLCSSVSAETETVVRGLGTYEAEELDINGQDVWTSVYGTQIPGYSGDGFIYLTNTPFSITIEVEEEGMYSLSARCAQLLSEDGRMQTFSINGIDYTYTLPYLTEWTDVDFGVYRLKEGENTIEFKTSYGYAEYDTITVAEAELDELVGTGVPCDPDATDETKALLSYLNSVYGEHVLSGQQEIYGGGHQVQTTIRYDSSTNTCVDSDGNTYTFDESSKDTADDGSTFVWTCYDEDGQAYNYDSQNRSYTYNDYDREFDYLYELTGEYPAIRGFDFGSYCPCYAWDDGVTERMIDWAVNQGGIVTASWHINVPVKLSDYTLGESLDFSKTTYGVGTDFVTANVLVEGTVEYEYFKLCMENLANELLQLQDAGVPVLFRPFHEAEGNGGTDGSGAWFWWSKEGTEVYKELWKYLYTTLTEEYGLHNLIWEENLYAWSDESAEWYVGDDYVDIVGFDKYDTEYNRHDGLTSGPNEDADSSVFWSLVDYVDNAKMVAMPENSTIPSVSNMTIEHANWLYFCTWYDEESSPKFISGSDYNNADTVTETYQSEYCITLSELPSDLYVYDDSETTTADTSSSDDDILYGDANVDGAIDISDSVAILSYISNAEKYPLSEQGLINADVNQRGDGISNNDALAIQRLLAQVILSLPESYSS
ncbi:MAG: beta-mannosidase [Ruminococcus sp.]|nr:beta-mannosidase [Ruminococcus sp.]